MSLIGLLLDLFGISAESGGLGISLDLLLFFGAASAFLGVSLSIGGPPDEEWVRPLLFLALALSIVGVAGSLSVDADGRVAKVSTTLFLGIVGLCSSLYSLFQNFMPSAAA